MFLNKNSAVVFQKITKFLDEFLLEIFSKFFSERIHK